MYFLDFEQPIAELEAKIEELRNVENDQDINVNKEISALKKRSDDGSRDWPASQQFCQQVNSGNIFVR